MSNNGLHLRSGHQRKRSRSNLAGRESTQCHNDSPVTVAPKGRKSSSSRKAKIRKSVHGCYIVVCMSFSLSIHNQFLRIYPSKHQRGYYSWPRPRLYFMDGAKRRARPIRDTDTTYFTKRQKKKSEKWSSSDDVNSENCLYVHEWQSASYPTCSYVHEINMLSRSFQLITNGHFRDVFGYDAFDGKALVLKELRFDYDFDFDKEHAEKHRRDAVAMMKLSASQYVQDIYACCANAAIVDFSSEGDLEAHSLASDKRYKNYTATEKLEIASQVALAIADVHDMDIAHTDIAPKQFLLIDGVYRLTDFNRARFLKFNDKKNETCKFFIEKNPGKGRSPEEYDYEWLTQKIDVYSMGNVFYYMLMGLKYFDGFTSKEAQQLVLRGERPELSKEISMSTDPSIHHLIRARTMIQKQSVEDRATAREVSNYLLGALKIEGFEY